MSEEEYSYYLRSALRCDEAMSTEQKIDPTESGGGFWHTVGTVALTALLVVLYVAILLIAPPSQGGN